MTTPMAGSVPCPRCATPNSGIELFCTNCSLYLRDTTCTVEHVTWTRRFFGSLLLEPILIVLTLVIGWFIWLFFSAKNAQSPAKSLTSIYIISAQTGRAVGAGDVWLRDVALKIIVAGIVPAGHLIDGIWALVDRDREAAHDKIVKSFVVYAPRGLPESMRYMPGAPLLYAGPGIMPNSPPEAASGDVGAKLRDLKQLHDDKLISDEEYERKRADLASRL